MSYLWHAYRITSVEAGFELLQLRYVVNRVQYKLAEQPTPFYFLSFSTTKNITPLVWFCDTAFSLKTFKSNHNLKCLFAFLICPLGTFLTTTTQKRRKICLFFQTPFFKKNKNFSITSQYSRPVLTSFQYVLCFLRYLDFSPQVSTVTTAPSADSFSFYNEHSESNGNQTLPAQPLVTPGQFFTDRHQHVIKATETTSFLPLSLNAL